ncbi:MAG: hypothetical protein ABUL49_01345, partial [bacterium]
MATGTVSGWDPDPGTGLINAADGSQPNFTRNGAASSLTKKLDAGQIGMAVLFDLVMGIATNVQEVRTGVLLAIRP